MDIRSENVCQLDCISTLTRGLIVAFIVVVYLCNRDPSYINVMDHVHTMQDGTLCPSPSS